MQTRALRVAPRRVAALVWVAATAACVDKAPNPSERVDPAYVEKNLLTEPPASLTNRVDTTFGDAVVYLGNDVSAETIGPGERFTITHYWKVLHEPGSKWRVFTHLVAGNGAGVDWQNADRSMMRSGHGPAKWKPGQIIRDEQQIVLGKGWKAPVAQVVVGLYRKGGRTVDDRMRVTSGPGDAEHRVVAARLAVDRDRQPLPPSSYVIRRASAPIAIDGRADEAAWRTAPASPAFVTAERGPAIQGQTVARLLWDDEYLYAFVTAIDSDVFSSQTNHDDPLWKEDVIELFIDADRNRRGYVELQVNPNNAQFDAWFATTRAAAPDVEWNAGMKSAVVVDGTAGDRGDRDRGWDVEIAIPLAAVKGLDEAMKVTIPPRVGDQWRLNIVRGDLPKGGRLAAASWNAITYQDFHALARMLEVTFGDERGNTKPAPEPAGAREAAEGATREPAEAENPAAGKRGANEPGAAKPSAGASGTPGASFERAPATKPAVPVVPAKPATAPTAKPSEPATKPN